MVRIFQSRQQEKSMRSEISGGFAVMSAVVLGFAIGTAALAAEPVYRPYADSVDALRERLCKDAQTTIDMGVCIGEAGKAIDAELNRAYQKIMKSFDASNENQAKEKELLKTEEKLWVALRDAQTSTVYQSNIEGTIRGPASAAHELELTHQRVLELKRRYLHLFYGEIEQKDFVGKWRDVAKPRSVFELTASGACTFVDGSTRLSGKCRRTELGLDMLDGSGKSVMSEWMYIDHLRLGGEDRLALELLRGGGDVERVFLKER